MDAAAGRRHSRGTSTPGFFVPPPEQKRTKKDCPLWFALVWGAGKRGFGYTVPLRYTGTGERMHTEQQAAYRPLSTGTLWFIAFVFFAAGTVVHVVCGDFPKSIDVMPDELRYLGIARSLFGGDGLIMHGDPSSFQKILYPLAIFPAMQFADGQAQVQAINVLNSIYACSTVFPVLAIARRLFRDPLPIVASMALAIILPDLMYSMTFMTECVYIPITTWLIYLCWRCMDADGRAAWAMALGAGVLCYAVYLCKEVAWMFPIAFAVCSIVSVALRERTWQEALMQVGLFIIGFLAPFIVMKLTLFSGMMNSYSQFTFDILLSPYTVLFGLYSLATDATYFIIGFGIFPVLLVALALRDLPRSERQLALFCLVSLVVGLAVVVFTISMREDVGHVNLRQHLRYVIPLYLPLLMLFIQQVARWSPKALLASPRRRGVLVGVAVGFCVLEMAFFGSANLRQGFDNSQFHFLRWLMDFTEPLAQEYHDTWGNVMSAIDTSDGDLLVINPLDWACRAAVALFAALGFWFLVHPSADTRLRAGSAVCAVLAVFMVANSVTGYYYNLGAYGAEQADIDEISQINDILANREEAGEVLVVLDEGNTKNNNLIDTYVLDGPGNYSYVKVDSLADYLNVDAEDDPKRIATPMSYLLVDAKQNVQVVSGNVEVVAGSGADDGEGRFILYRITDGALPKVIVGE